MKKLLSIALPMTISVSMRIFCAAESIPIYTAKNTIPKLQELAAKVLINDPDETAKYIGDAILERIEVELREVRDCHDGPVCSLAYGSGGKKLCSASQGSLRTILLLRNVLQASSPIVHTIKTAFGDYAIASTSVFSPCGNMLAWNAQEDIQIRNTTTGELLRTLIGHAAPVLHLAFNHDGTLLASGSNDRSVKIWNPRTGTLLHTLPDEPHIVKFNHDGSMLASGSDNGIVRLWNPHTGELVRIMRGHEKHINCLVFNSDSALLATSSDDNLIQLWHTMTGSPTYTLRDHERTITALACSPTMLASGSEDATVRLWNPVTGASMQILHAGGTRVSALTFSSSGSMLALGTSVGVRLWHLTTQRFEDIAHNSHGNRVCSLLFSPDDTTIAWGLRDGTIKLLWLYENIAKHITDPAELLFIVHAASSWFAHKPHQVEQHDPIYQQLIKRFAFLCNPLLFSYPDTMADTSGNQIMHILEHVDAPEVQEPALVVSNQDPARKSPAKKRCIIM